MRTVAATVNTPATATLSPPWWRRPMVIVTAGCLISIITFGVRSSFGLFTTPLVDLRGWDREAFALAMAFQNLLWGLTQPIAGAIADRFGAARVLAIGGLIYAAGVVLMAISTNPVMLTMTGGVIIGIGIAGGSFTVVIAAFSRLVEPSKRSWAFGLATAAGSMGQFLFAPLGQAFISTYGPQTALILLAGTLLLVPLFARSLTGSAYVAGASDDPDDLVSAGQALRAAGTYPSYLMLAAGFFVCGFHIAFVTTHLPAYLTDHGMSVAVAAWSISLIGLFNVIGAYTSGILAGRWPRRYLLSAIYLARGAVFAIFLVAPVTTATVVITSMLLGLLWLSTVPPTSGLVALMFGTRHVGMLFGMVFLSHQVGAFIGALLGGTIYEQTGSYHLMWILCIVLSIGAGLVHLPIKERRARTAEPTAEGSTV
ncbi:hypothetical protein KILIM_066_00020 [Kineosphaera limosa NBRC 100340]|uniref:Major facilitator superfamily (MFS) profile domain-containing protein n=1 Tax=Kineosphaera limosa NBRC 100340 TaxID=1184609 RepID=K6WZ43_9MICO|nr:hypothetical protein KILIM_066_00020 [Kineosphaera limosa NBRC 100340]